MDNDQSVTNHLFKIGTVSGLAHLKKDDKIIQEIMSLDGARINSLPASVLSKYILCLSQYASFLQLMFNMSSIDYLNAKRDYEHGKNKAILTLTEPLFKTLKEKTAYVETHDETVQELEMRLREKEVPYLYLTNMSSSVNDIANALKKELSLRKEFN